MAPLSRSAQHTSALPLLVHVLVRFTVSKELLSASLLFALPLLLAFVLFFFNDTATTEIYTLSLHDALPILTVPLSAIVVPVTVVLSSVSVLVASTVT